jgi:hypothetical protein
MSDRSRGAGRDAEVPIMDPEGMGALLAVINSVNMSSGKPGPGDEWKFPTRSAEAAEIQTEGEALPEPATRRRRMGLLRGLTRRG